jgi:hypothetical protein
MATPESGRRRSRTFVYHPLDEAVLLVSVPVWTRDNVLKEYPDQPPDALANLILSLRYRRQRARLESA